MAGRVNSPSQSFSGMRERRLGLLSQAVFLVMSAARSGGAHTIGSLSPVWMVRVSRSQVRMVPRPGAGRSGPRSPQGW
jgi:hypothetical protein